MTVSEPGTAVGTGAGNIDGQAVGTATGTGAGNIDGQAIAITVFSTVKWWGKLWLPILFTTLRLIPPLTRDLRKLSFIHFARWTLIRELPANGDTAPRTRLRYPHLFFESNFNDGWEEYIDAFSYVLTRGMSLFWASSYGFPGALPTGPFKDYIHRNELEAAHYYSAYPEATATMVQKALALAPAVADFAERAGRLSPAEFEGAWSAFLTDAQDLL
ncbi:hypothetical protein ACG83_13230 [Frankia sp. R43]|uniref:hypothetical protein n=1 Tax=Frankia sp. R43 TaxID=269536 RepID=UPI0006C9FDA9|nr:hypothetical protein [Frankia sp. R43]KPM56106.1 hypothetical protein ACG83_13230 [Frankia sp. R43]